MPTEPRSGGRFAGLSALIALPALLAACVTAQPQGNAPAKPPVSAAAPAAAAAVKPPQATQVRGGGQQAPANTATRPFSDVSKGFERLPGFLTVWRKDDRYLLELSPDDFKHPFFFSTQRRQGIGERGLWSGMMLESGIGKFILLSDRVQWIEKNTRFRSDGNAPLDFAVHNAFSGSLRGVSPVLSRPDPKTGAILVDLNSLALNDFSASASQLQRLYRQPYQFDRNNSRITTIDADPQETGVTMVAHYSAPMLASGSPGQPVQPSVPTTVPDPRSLFLGFTLSFSPLPDEMRGRVADPRVGYFHTEHFNFHDDLASTPREYLIHRWRLEKKDPSAAISEPKEPITYWLGRNIPERYRDTVRDAILAWNAAFERIGFRNAIVVRQQPDDASWNSGARRFSTVQWYLGTDNTAALGPSLVDPRSGEILDADVVLDDHRLRSARRQMQYGMPQGNGEAAHTAHAGEHDDAHCAYADNAFADLGQALELMHLHNEDLTGERSEKVIRDTLRSVVMHEIGHTLGLRHNFRASSVYPLAKLADPAFTAKHGLAGSVMDYLPVNTPLKGEARSALVQDQLGPYDYWAIAYGYTPFAPDKERDGLRAIAARADSDPLLAYGEDTEAGAADGNLLTAGADPSVARRDLGNDPVAWLDRQLKITQELFQALRKRPAIDSDPDQAIAMRESVARGLNLLVAAAGNAARNIGGIHFNRSPGASDRASFRPVSAAEQRRTLRALATGLFDQTGFELGPNLLSRLPPPTLNGVAQEPMLPLVSVLQQTQGRVLDQLFSNRTSARLLEASLIDARSFPLAELHSTLRRDIWRELGRDGDISLPRRNLQRAHLSRVVTLILQGGKAPADARAIARMEATTLQAAVRQGLKRSGRSLEARAHLLESLATLDEALRAPVLRQTP